MTEASPDHLQDNVRSHMRSDFVLFDARQTVGEALRQVRENPPAGRIIYFYVADEAGRLAGVVPTRRLLMSAPDARLASIMIHPVIAVPDSSTVLEACEFFVMHRLLAFPVVDADGRMVGLIDVELYTQELDDLERREGNEDLFQLIGVHLTDAQQASLWQSFRTRFPWLLANVAGGLLAAVIADIYGDVATLAIVVPFIPVVLALAESVTIQSVSLTIQALHGRRPTWGMLPGRMGREVRTGLLLGLGTGMLVGLAALIWKRHALAALTLLGGIGSAVACAAGIGLSLPFLLRLMKRDPQVAAGPVALALTDFATLLLYFNLARVLLR